MAARLREVFLDGRWIANTNYKEQLSLIDWQQATQKVADLNSIAALTFHINYYLEGLLEVFNDGKLTISDAFSFDASAINSEDTWDERVRKLLKNAEEFARQVEKLSDEALSTSFVEEKYGSYERNIEAVIEHSYYHLGQISLLRKMIQC